VVGATKLALMEEWKFFCGGSHSANETRIL